MMYAGFPENNAGCDSTQREGTGEAGCPGNAIDNYK
jgi:hypothetical protein